MWFLVSACIPHLYTGDDDTEDNCAGTGTSGFDRGERPPDFMLTDQNGEVHSLCSYVGTVVLVDISTMWCAPCQELAQSTQATADAYEEQGFAYLTVLQQDVEGGLVDQDELNEWADSFQITEPILDDSAEPYALDGAVKDDGGYPVVLIVDREGVIARRLDLPVEETVIDAIEDVI